MHQRCRIIKQMFGGQRPTCCIPQGAVAVIHQSLLVGIELLRMSNRYQPTFDADRHLLSPTVRLLKGRLLCTYMQVFGRRSEIFQRVFEALTIGPFQTFTRFSFLAWGYFFKALLFFSSLGGDLIRSYSGSQKLSNAAEFELLSLALLLCYCRK